MSGRAVLVALVLGLAGTAETAAQATVYRCGPDGRSYSQQPCAEGRAIDVDDARSPDQRTDGTAAVRRDAALARQLERERRLMESRAPRAVGLNAPRPASVTAARADPPKGRARTRPRAAKPPKPAPAAPSKQTAPAAVAGR